MRPVNNLEAALFHLISEGIEDSPNVPQKMNLLSAMERIESLERKISEMKASFENKGPLKNYHSSELDFFIDEVKTLKARESEFQASKRKDANLPWNFSKPVQQETMASSKASSFEDHFCDMTIMTEPFQRILNEKISKKELKQSIDDLTKEVNEIKMETSHYNRMKVLAWAIENAHQGEFTYFSSSGSKYQSKDLVVFILLNFRRKQPECTFAGSKYTTARHQENGHQRFLEKLSRQIEQLTGVKPRLKKQSNGDYSIYRSGRSKNSAH